VGLGAAEPVIENGLARMALDYFRDGAFLPRRIDVPAANRSMEARLRGIAGARRRWADAIDQGSEGQVIPGVAAESPPQLRPFHFRNTLRRLLAEAGCAFVTGAGYVSQATGRIHTRNLRVLLSLLALAGSAGFVWMLPKLGRAALMWLRHLPVDGSVRQIALALRDALCEADLIRTAARRLKVKTERRADGSWLVALAGAEFYEQSLFADSLSELLGSIENPRYLLTREDDRGPLRRVDYHAVPTALAVRKKRAALLHRAWARRVGPARLIYTRTAEGRALLLRARARAFSTAWIPRAERLDRWQ
jgi:hypothetical protein